MKAPGVTPGLQQQIDRRPTKIPTPIKTVNEELKIRISGPANLPTLVYCPGLHGDWTLIGGFKRALRERCRLVEITYPRTLEWSLDDYGAAIEAALEERGIRTGWLLGESFGSQVVWSLVRRGKFLVTGVILAGGFVRYPVRWGVQFAARVAGGISLRLITTILFGYAKIARYRFRNSPETVASFQEFIDRRTELDRQAAQHRLRLIAAHDPSAVACSTTLPVYALTGGIDPIVPWVFTRPWLKRNCATLKDYRIIWTADHNVMGTAPERASTQILRWMGLLA
jgi:pimeloyl-ACP methyl ester carboxylesterase